MAAGEETIVTGLVDSIPRLELDDLTPAVQDVLRARVERLGYLGEFFKCAGHQPDVLVPFMQMTEALKRALPDRLTEVGALSVAGLMGNDYERHQHERLSRKLGFDDDWIRAVEQLAPDRAPDLSPEEADLQRFILALIERRGKGVEAELGAVIRGLGADGAVAVLFLVGRYITHALIVNALGLQPPVSSIFSKDPV